MKPYRFLPIEDCGEPLVPIPAGRMGLWQPPPYQALGAPYAQLGPYHLRQGVLTALLAAQDQLEEHHPGWRLLIYDAYRPVAVQRYMVDYTLQTLMATRTLAASALTVSQREALLAEVYQVWAVPSDDPRTPPPHSTGAAVDLTLMDGAGRPVDMGSAIDELSPRSLPDHYAPAGPVPDARYHEPRSLLNQVMTGVGFVRHPEEWWHFSLGDQLWAWQLGRPAARYGRVGD